MEWVVRCEETKHGVGWADLYESGELLATALGAEWWFADRYDYVSEAESHRDAKDAAWAAVYRSTR